MGWFKEIFSPVPDNFYLYAMRHSSFLKKLTFKQTGLMHDAGQEVGAEYRNPTRLPNGMIGPPHSMFGEYIFLIDLCKADGDTRNREQLDLALEKFSEEFSKENGWNFW